MVSLRDTTEADFKAITALYAREVREGTATFELEPPSQIEIAHRFASVKGYGLPWITAEVDGAFAGYAYLSPFRMRAAYRYAVENSVYVLPGMQGRGVGRALLNAVVGEARALGLVPMLHYFGDDPAAFEKIIALAPPMINLNRADLLLAALRRARGDRWA